NVGDRLANIQAAVRELSRHFSVVAVSPVYQTKPMYDTNQPDFLNAVVKAHTQKTVGEAVQAVRACEAALGKKKEGENGPRNIDIDFLLFGDFAGNADGFDVPHPKIAERAFVLAPLMDVAPKLKHPVLQKTASELWDALLESEQKNVEKMGDKIPAVSAAIEPIQTISQAEELIAAIGVDDVYAVKTMAQKTITKVVRLPNIRCAMANILKQEMLSLGGDAAVHQDAVSCKVESTDVLLIGTLKQLRQLVSKLRVQVAEAQQIAYAVDEALREQS
ncbi:MAG: 2-amino-4-hydroxy-6-hydroxymethyldihydropteridine diphosphokinase, partial [Candidatus Micrarchaeota archaeon]|nr:2-amino-4-hydroxy-6-hydroxymethyldihydropteridine diphosphokinase [Candidatus Micrarchaeota archaeon]